MNPQLPDDLSQLSMLELFRVETENQSGILTQGLLELERGEATPQTFETLMRAAHSLKGAARIVNLPAAVRTAHAMEDCFVAAQRGKAQLARVEIDVLLRGVDVLLHLARRDDGYTDPPGSEPAGETAELLQELRKIAGGPSESSATPTGAATSLVDVTTQLPQETAPPQPPETLAPARAPRRADTSDRVVRLTAENLNRLLGLAGESLVESRWLRPFSESLQRLKRQHTDLSEQCDQLRRTLEQEHLSERADLELQALARSLTDCQQSLAARMEELDSFDRRSAHHAHRLYLEVLRTRMRPFADGVRRFPRMVRDLARSLGKEVRLEIAGEQTQVDRDILEQLETPLAHLLRNSVDHGCEAPAERARVGKTPVCLIRLEARHSAGMLMVTVSDEGAGVDPDAVRQAVVRKKLTTAAIAEKLTDAELYEFLFLPGFTMKETVTEISGRGVGLDVVQNMIKNVRGGIRLTTQPGRGLRVQLQLPLTLSVLRALLVEIAGEPYAIPLTQIARTLKLRRDSIHSLEGRPHFQYGDQPVGLLSAHQVLDCGETKPPGLDMPVVVLGERNARYGMVVDRFLGERELVVQPLDARLGKVQDISAAALMEDGSPVLIVDVEDLVRSIEKLVALPQGGISSVRRDGLDFTARRPKRVLAVDDSLTVRELERKLLTGRGYHTDVAVDGVDGWNAVRSGQYDLVVTDVDMPRMDGIELAALIKRDPKLRSVPVLIVSYKEQEEDRLRGLEAGADYYLTKGSFHDETLLQAVVDLIGEPNE